MRSLPLIIVAGGDDLALRACEELCAMQGHEVVFLSRDPAHEGRVRLAGARFARVDSYEYRALEQAGIGDASLLMLVGPDDRENLQVALKARDVNPAIRLILRQFNRGLGRKIEQNLPNCTAISPAAHAAATYAASAIDPACIYALQFPDIDGPLLHFSARSARDFSVIGLTVAQAERRLHSRIVALASGEIPKPERRLRESDRIVACGKSIQLSGVHAGSGQRRSLTIRRFRANLADLQLSLGRIEPVLLRLFAAAAGAYFVAAWHFAQALRVNYLTAMYFTTQTMATVGFGDITPLQRHAGNAALVATIVLVMLGVSVSGVFIATIVSALDRSRAISLQGLRRIHRDGHVVVCGAGNVGSRVVDFLLQLRQQVVVVERRPNSLLVELARDRRIDLLSGDATTDETLAFCDLRSARGFIATTDSDAANLEAALGARVQNPS
ncbi:MAG: NAD-binding protein, partial [Candidatus Eremiobacteraeota bacterium]|nr:NAD-binding protein [Candidatus Eremiobacteraeota bacterium]